MNIIQISKYANPAVQGVDLFEEIVRSFPGHNFHFFIMKGSTEGLEDRLDCQVTGLNMKASQVKRIRFPALLFFYKNIKKYQNADVFITHRIAPTFFVALTSFLFPPARKIAVIHGVGQFRKPRRRLFARLFLKRWKIVAVSGAVYDDLLKSGFGKHQVRLIKNAIDSKIVRDNLYPRAEARKKLSMPDHGGRSIGTIGRLHPVKGHKLLIKAMTRLQSRCNLTIIGDGSLYNELNEQIRKDQLEESVFLAGNRKNAYKYLKAFDVFIMSSLSEGLPISVLEAISAGVPCFGTRAGGIPEILPQPEWLIPPGDTSALTTLLDHINRLSDEELRNIAKEQRRIMEEQFSIESYRASYQKLVLDD